MTNEKKVILAGLAPLFERARKEKLAFYCNYQGMWFSPDELEKLQSSGRFIWGACNWQLRDPKERVDEAIQSAQSAKEKSYTIQEWAKKI